MNSLTSLPMCGFTTQLVGHCTGIAGVTGSNPVEALIFSGFFFPIAYIRKLTSSNHRLESAGLNALEELLFKILGQRRW